jgi:hypothetical protein
MKTVDPSLARRPQVRSHLGGEGPGAGRRSSPHRGKFARFAIAAALACVSSQAFAGNLLWQGSWTNQSDKAVQLKTNASQCFDPGQFSNKNVLSPGDNMVIRATATTDWPICTGGDYWLVINVVEADSPNTIRGQVTLKFHNSANACYLTSDRAGVTAPATPCPPSDNTASYSVEIVESAKYDLTWGLVFPKGEGSPPASAEK